jgi:hypothetical protein
MSDVAELKHLVKSLQQASSDKVRRPLFSSPFQFRPICLIYLLIFLYIRSIRRSSTFYKS